MDDQHAQPGLPGVRTEPPRWASQYLRAARKHYEDGVTRAPSNADIAANHEPQIGVRTWDRRKKKLQDGSLGRDWLEGVWPPPKNWHPAWEVEFARPTDEEPSNGVVRFTYEEVYADGKLVERRLIDQIGHLAALVAVAAGMVLELGHGHSDGAVHAGHFLHTALHAIICRTVA